MYECTVIKQTYGQDEELLEERIKDFGDIQMAYIWIQEDLGIRIPSETNVSIIDNYECMSFRFTVELLNINTRREGFDFGVVPVMSDNVSYVIYYKNPE